MPMSFRTIGIAIRDTVERSLVVTAAINCGMDPLELDALTQPEVSLEADGVDRIPERRTVLGAKSPLLLIITDDGQLADRLKLADDCSNLLERGVTQLILVGDHAQNAEAYSWKFERPLQLASLVSQLTQAKHAARRFAADHRSMRDELLRARKIFNSMSNGVTLSDARLPDHPLIYVNPAFERITGYPSTEVYGRNSRFLQGGETVQPDLPKVREAVRTCSEVQATLRNYRKDGTPFWNELYMAPIFDSEGNLTHFVGFQNDVTARVEAARQVEHLAHHDALTGLANRSLLMEYLKMAFARAERTGHWVALLFFDLNHFKFVNDTFGHEAGDNLLHLVAQRLQENLRSSEMAARIGGDEFVAVIEEISSRNQATEVLARIASAIDQPAKLSSLEFRPSASVGMALFPEDGNSPEALLKVADARMYEAKHEFHVNERTAAPARETTGAGVQSTM